MTSPVRIHRDERASVPSSVPAAFLTSTLSAALGRNGYYLASAWILVEAGFGSAGVATALAIVSAVEFVASPLAGMAADRFDRRRLNIVADLGRVIVMLATACAIPFLDVLLTICLSAALVSFCDRIALTSAQSMIPAITRGSDRATSNSIVFFAMQFGSFGAALLTGPLLDEHSPALVFLILSAFFLVSAGCLSSGRLVSAADPVGNGNGSAPAVDQNLLPLFTVYALLYGSAVLISAMGSSYVFDEQKGTATDFGCLEAAWSAGSLAGTVFLVRLNEKIGPHALHAMLLGLNGLALTALMSLRAPWTLIVFAILGFLYNLGRVSVELTLQSRVSDDLLGRAKGAMHSLAVALGLAIFGIPTVLGDKVFPSTIFFSFGMALVISAFVLSTTVARQKGDA